MPVRGREAYTFRRVAKNPLFQFSRSAHSNYLHVHIYLGFCIEEYWWVWSLVLFSPPLVIGLFARILHRRSIRDQRNRIANDFHDDLGADLVRIAMSADLLSNDCEDETLKIQLKDIAGMCRKALVAGDDLVWLVKFRGGSISNLANRMKEHLHHVLTPLDIDHSLELTIVDPLMVINDNVQRNIYLIFKEGLNNLVKHSRADFVKVIIQQHGQKFRMNISDNGVGMKGETYGNGIRNMESRALEIGASLEVKSSGGTTIILDWEIPKGWRWKLLPSGK